MEYGMGCAAKLVELKKLTKNQNLMLVDAKSEHKQENVFLGTLGKGYKINVFSMAEFVPELAPQNAKIEKLDMDGKTFIRMTYEV